MICSTLLSVLHKASRGTAQSHTRQGDARFRPCVLIIDLKYKLLMQIFKRQRMK